MTAKAARNEERSFGISVGAMLLLIAAILMWRGRMMRAEIVGGTGAVLLLAGLVYAPLLKYPKRRLVAVLARARLRERARAAHDSVLDRPGPAVAHLAAHRQGSAGAPPRQWPGWTPYPPRYRNPKHYERMY